MNQVIAACAQSGMVPARVLGAGTAPASSTVGSAQPATML
jgi:hypothetical protein